MNKLTFLIKRKIRSFSVNFNTPVKFYRIFPSNYFRYFKYKGSIPLKHVATYEALVKLKTIFDQISVDFYLAQGALLGAYRQNNFAGRPKDIDLFIKDTDLKKVFKNFKYLHKNGFYIVQLKVNKGIVNIQPPMGSPISLMSCEKGTNGLYKRSELEEKVINEIKINLKISRWPREKDWDKSHEGMEIDFSKKCWVLLYKSYFLIPVNALEKKKKKYGSNWRTPLN